MDDVLGNISKQWNNHHVIYMLNGLLSWQMIKQEFSIQFISGSPHTTPIELMQGMKDSIHHGGLKCNYLCHTCKVGGMNMEKSMDEGYSNIFKIFQLFMCSDGTEKVRNALSQSSVWDQGTKQMARKPTLSEAEITAHLKAELDVLLGDQSLNDHINLLLGMLGLDIHKDTLTEILYMVLLGVVKYFWMQTVHILDKNHSLRMFQREDLNSSTLNADYILRYKYGLIGKHFKKMVLCGWSVIGKLVVLLWHTSIEDIESYLVSPLV
ncbi:hypothetical protein F5I97DRAFT_1937442 [Phlebopus sp. FC_14]|nr:hypothetical protein F5I97DRAFT_1937442 [Phlebopus sp. FC_14]